VNRSPVLSTFSIFLFRIGTKLRRLISSQHTAAFGRSRRLGESKIGGIYVINLDRCPDRWAEMQRELSIVTDADGIPLSEMTTRCSAVDAKDIVAPALAGEEVYPYYTLADQLKVDPQPLAMPDRVELERPIAMTPQEVAIAMSHIGVWREIATGKREYALVLEDDVWFQFGFARQLDKAWRELTEHNKRSGEFDILYLSYKEVTNGAQKLFRSENIFCPIIGLWYLSGYVLSRHGAQKLLKLLPCYGPVDLWINHQFGELSVRATSQPIVEQRLDEVSTNLYSVLPVLNRIGAIDSENASLFQIRPTERPVFVFGSGGSGMSSVAMALSMLGYRCCSDLETLPPCEYERLMTGDPERIFDAYVNIGSLDGKAQELSKLFPSAKFVVTTIQNEVVDDKIQSLSAEQGSVTVLCEDEVNKWRVICEHLRCAPPLCPFPELPDIGQRQTNERHPNSTDVPSAKILKRDSSPWGIEPHWNWKGITVEPSYNVRCADNERVTITDALDDLDPNRWMCRNDTFPGNLALFQSKNVEILPESGAALRVRKESLGVRNFGAAAISSCTKYLYGRFEAVIKASNVPGVITGFFLHRDSPRQEIDIEIPGNRPDSLLVNVFYNPGDEGARFDYGYRGAPNTISLGFDASQSDHSFAIEWKPEEISWFVDNRLVHRRVNWNPTPIPHLPMTLHVNAWPTRSKELAGRLKARLLPAEMVVRSIVIDSVLPGAKSANEQSYQSLDSESELTGRAQQKFGADG
jgi:GR25 family glycosyltransferase involved in LPS biosynthesis/beta-glucanase (GH16 family)